MNNIVKPQIESSWLELLQDEFNKEYFMQLKKFLLMEKRKYIIYPTGSLIFNAFNLTPVHKLKVVLLGQDPYHGPNQAHGLCFSVPEGVPLPPSLKNIFIELSNDIGCDVPQSGNLSSWARQGVLLLNTSLTVRKSQANSHQDKGWHIFTDAIIQKLSTIKKNLVFILWGSNAKSKTKLIDQKKHLIISSAHPSPLSAYRGFFASQPFSRTNEYLIQHNNQTINWQL